MRSRANIVQQVFGGLGFAAGLVGGRGSHRRNGRRRDGDTGGRGQWRVGGASGVAAAVEQVQR